MFGGVVIRLEGREGRPRRRRCRVGESRKG